MLCETNFSARAAGLFVEYSSVRRVALVSRGEQPSADSMLSETVRLLGHQDRRAVTGGRGMLRAALRAVIVGVSVGTMLFGLFYTINAMPEPGPSSTSSSRGRQAGLDPQ
jgi:hypothetical protein